MSDLVLGLDIREFLWIISPVTLLRIPTPTEPIPISSPKTKSLI